MKILIVCLVFLFCVILLRAQKNTDSISRKLIIGSWVSNEDKNSMVVFTADRKLDYYEGKFDSSDNKTNYYWIRNDSLIVGSKDPQADDKLYYRIEGVSEKYLSLEYLGRYNLLTFQRKPPQHTSH